MKKEPNILARDKSKKKISGFMITTLLIYAVFCFALLFVKATTNFSTDSEVIEFAHPFDVVLLFTFIIWGAMIVLAVLTNRKIILLIRRIAWVNIYVSIFVACFYLLPCLYGNSEILSLKEKLFDLFFCPSFNLTSWLNIFAVIAISLLMLMSSSMGKRVLRRKELKTE